MEKLFIMFIILFFIGLLIIFSPINSNLWLACVAIAILQGAWIWSKSK